MDRLTLTLVWLTRFSNRGSGWRLCDVDVEQRRGDARVPDELGLLAADGRLRVRRDVDHR